jgi:protein-L-isoaspartate(D-aspartate) O-methyltransferase
VNGIEPLIAQIQDEVRGAAGWLGRGQLGPRTIAALRRVPRDAFVPDAMRHRALENRPLPIGHGQTISQPFVVAIMSDLLELGAGDRVLEIGTGSGYQAAVLAELSGDVYSIETVPALAEAAAERLRRAGYERVHLRTGDGWAGWPEAAPFDAIIVTAAGPTVPPALLAQLRAGGRLLMPIGQAGETQYLTLLTKDAAGGITRKVLLPVAFVPLVGRSGPTGPPASDA